MVGEGGSEVLVHASAEHVAEGLAARLMARLMEIQRDFRIPQVALTGGRIATKAYQRLAAEGAQSAVDWSRVSCGGATSGSSVLVTMTATTRGRSSC